MISSAVSLLPQMCTPNGSALGVQAGWRTIVYYVSRPDRVQVSVDSESSLTGMGGC